jgi:hypothetical protein
VKRHPALEPFSRDHNDGLILARGLQLAREGADKEFKRAWDVELRDHFAEEERLLGPLAESGMRDQMMSEHRTIERLMGLLPMSGPELGDALHDHIRWEERALFPAIEASATPEMLRSLAEETDRLEQRRWKQDSRRETLVRRRKR